ncbi:MAG: hypothetical protein NC337_11505 [Roseburia sp.]|nr:hypothetical protein [Roseburia sp.]
MSQGYLMIVFLLIIGLLPAAAWLAVNREDIERGYTGVFYIKTVLFFFFCNYFAGSAAKWYLESPSKTLPESFLNTEPRTYIHYGVIVLLMDMALLAVCCRLLRQWSNKLVGIFDAWMLIFIVSMGFFSVSVTNMLYCALAMVCGILSSGLVFIGKVNPVYFTPREYLKAFREAVPAVASWLVTIGIYLPSELYINNANEFAIGYGGGYITALLAGSVAIGLLLMAAAVVLLSWKCYNLFVLFLSGISIMSYLQALFLNGRLRSLTGEEQTWGLGIQAANLVFWILIIGIITAGGFYKPGIKKGCKAACIYIMLIQTVSLGYLLITEDLGDTARRPVLTTDRSLALAEEDNIILFILDRFDSNDFDELIKDTEFVQPLADFTFYENATSQYGNTKEALPYILEGVEYRYNVQTNRMEQYKDTDRTALSRLYQAGYDIGIYTLTEYLSDDLRSMAVNYNETAAYSCDYADTITTMLRTSMYRTMPFAIKPRYRYYSTDIAGIAEVDGAWNILNDLPFYQSLIKDGLYVDENCQSAFRFYHMDGVHPPFCLSEEMYYDKEAGYTEQSRACLKIVYEYLEQLKALGKYESATIIITADHGNPAKRDGKEEQLLRVSTPILLVKEPYRQQEKMLLNSAPVTQAEILPSILKAAGFTWSECGRAFDEVPESEERERAYQYDDSTSEIVIEYSINGYVKDLDNWRVENTYHY